MSGFLKMLRSRKIAIAGLAFLGFIVLMALLAPLVAPINPLDMDPANRLLSSRQGSYLWHR